MVGWYGWYDRYDSNVLFPQADSISPNEPADKLSVRHRNDYKMNDL